YSGSGGSQFSCFFSGLHDTLVSVSSLLLILNFTVLLIIALAVGWFTGTRLAALAPVLLQSPHPSYVCLILGRSTLGRLNGDGWISCVVKLNADDHGVCWRGSVLRGSLTAFQSSF